MARTLDVDWQDDADTLRECYLESKDHQDCQRLQLLWLVREGETLTDAAETVGAGYRTAQDWIGWYREGGLEEVLSRRHGGGEGRPARLSGDQEQALAEKAREGEVRTIWRRSPEWARSEADVEYTYWGMRHVFERLDLKKKVPRPQSPKADPEEQERWKKGT